jgi:hypothetical protein
MFKTIEFWLILYLICLVFTILSLFDKIYKADEKEKDKHSIDSMRKLVANLEVPYSSGLVHDIFNDDGDILQRTFWYNSLLYIVIKPTLIMLVLCVIYFINIIFYPAD